MNKSTKSLVAAGAAAVLLTGGAGSLAYWTSNSTVAGGSVQAGKLALSAASCTPASGWVYASSSKVNAGAAVTKIVPGDVVSKTCTFTITAEGDNLKANLTTPANVTIGSATPSGTSMSATVSAAYTVAGAAAPSVVTSADNGKTVTATITATIPFGTDETGNPKVNANDMQNVTATLNDITVSLVQTNHNA